MERFWAKVDKTDTCWLWTATVTKGGYGMFYFNGHHVYAHRFAYEWFVGPIPAGLQIDHVRSRGCRHRHCVNPAHLEAVTQRENLLRGDTISARAAAATHCPQGHPYSGDNLQVRKTGKRNCRECHREQNRRSWAKRRGAA